MAAFIDIKTLSSEFNLPDGTIRRLMRGGKIPFLRLGYRTLRFEPKRVKTALEELERRGKSPSAGAAGTSETMASEPAEVMK